MADYDAFAACYDALMQDADYDARAVVCRDLLARYGVRDGILLDFACGTGSMAVRMARMGFDVIGVDASESMLCAAQQKAAEQGVRILFLCQTMQELDLYGTVRGTICTLDSLNHLTRKADFERAIRRVALFTEPGGMFVFDVNTVYKHRHVLADHTFVIETDDVYCVWQNAYGRQGTVQIMLDLFQKDGNVYIRASEQFAERAYEAEWIVSTLGKYGFTVCEILDADTMKTPGQRTERLLFAAKKEGQE